MYKNVFFSRYYSIKFHLIFALFLNDCSSFFFVKPIIIIILFGYFTMIVGFCYHIIK